MEENPYRAAPVSEDPPLKVTQSNGRRRFGLIDFAIDGLWVAPLVWLAFIAAHLAIVSLLGRLFAE